MAKITDKGNSSNEIGDDFADISNKDSVQPVVASTSIVSDCGEGTITGVTTGNEKSKERSHVEPNVTEIDTRTDNLNKSKCIEKGSEVLNDSTDLELQWDEDDENNTILDSDTHKIDDDLEKKLLQETEQNNQDVSNELDKETDTNLEEKLLQEPINSMETSENQKQNQTEVEMELNEDELLLEGQPEDTEAIDVDNVKESIMNILDVSKSTEVEQAVTNVEVKQTPRSNDDHQNSNKSIEVDVSIVNTVKPTSCFNKPDVMIEIPTQEIDINDLLDSPNGEEDYESMEDSHNTSEEVTVHKPEPSTSTNFPKLTADMSEEAQEATDCLGLLAESSRVMDDDDDDADADDDEDDDFDQDESSNQMTAEHSEDSNAPYSETELARDDDTSEEMDITNDIIKIEKEENITSTDVLKETAATNEPQDSINKENEDKNVLACGTIEKDSTSQDDVEKDKKENIPTCVAEDKESESKEKDGATISHNDVARKNKENNVASTTEQDSTALQDNMNETIEESQEETVHMQDDTLQPESSVQSVDLANKETEIPFGVTIKTEKDDSTKRRRPVKIEVVKKYIETQISDDVFEQVLQIETVKISDDEDDEPTKETQENLQKGTDKTATGSEKNTIAEEVTALEETTAIEKSTEPAVAAESSAPPEKPPEVEKRAEGDDAVINLTTEQTNTEASHTAVSSTTSPKSYRTKNLTVSNLPNTSIISVVELGESSSEDDIQEISKGSPPDHSVSHLRKLLDSGFKPPPVTCMTTVNIPTEIDVMTTSGIGGNTTQILTKEGEVVISGVPKPPPLKTARLNTSEVTIKATSSTEQTLVIPEAKSQNQNTTSTATKPRLSLEIFSLDSDEEETPSKELEKPKKKTKKCVNSACSSGSMELQVADSATAEYYDAAKKKRSFVCQPCVDAVLLRKQKLIAGIKNMTSLMKLDSNNSSQDLVEISDSESDDEDTEPQEQQQPKEKIGEGVANFLEENLAAVLNETWKKYKLDDRLKETQDEINAEILKLEQEGKEINQMLDDCQRATDKLRTDLYATFDRRNVEQPSILIYDTPEFGYIGSDTEDAIPERVKTEFQARMKAKRKLATSNEVLAKRPAIPLGYTPLETNKSKGPELKPDDDKDVSVVKLSAEAAPADLPPPGELSRPPLRVGMAVYAMKNAFGPWFKGKVMEITPKTNTSIQFTMCRIKFDHKLKNSGKILPARCIAYAEPAEVRMTIGTRLIALFKDKNKRESYYSGVVAEIPNPVNNYRYLVFFDDGYAQYINHANTRVVCECSNLVWEEVHPLSRVFVRDYLMAYPERPMVRLHEGQHLKTEWNGKWWTSRVVRVDASLAQVVFLGDGRREWIYRGSTRLAPLYLELRAAERHRPRPMPRSTQPRSNLLPYVEYTRSVEQPTNKAQETQPVPVALSSQQQTEEIRCQRAVAKKSTVSTVGSAAPVGPTPVGSALPVAVSSSTSVPNESENSRVVYYTPKNAVRPYKLVTHTCSPACKRDILSLTELRTYNPLAKPLLSGWERQIVRFKGQREVLYRAPCGRRLRNMAELHRYLRLTQSELPVDLFDFYHVTHCLAEFVLHKCLVGKKDLSHGKENVPVPCVNCYDDSLPEFCSYNTERTPTSGVPLNLDPEFLCGCDCTDDCADKTKCACWKLTLEGARTIGLDGVNVGYEYKRLPDPLPSGIYECNSRCKCKRTCLNRVAQHPLQLKLQVFKTLKRGWGIRALNDVPKGSFLCVYAGNLLTDATANLDGLNEGDEYLAELDYIEVVEQMKEGYEEDIPDADKKLDKKESTKADDSEEEIPSSSEDDENASKTDKEDDDFRPGHVSLGVSGFSKSLRERSKKKTDTKEEKEKENKGDPEDDCITISDDDEVREPSRFTANPGMAGNDFVSKYRSVRTLFGEDEACYIMDAKVQGNIGRYLNHSCAPNVFVQNVFVDTHDPRFPWVAFFALSHVRAGTELTWNYNYDVGSVPGKVLYCYCGAPNCRGRLL